MSAKFLKMSNMIGRVCFSSIRHYSVPLYVTGKDAFKNPNIVIPEIPNEEFLKSEDFEKNLRSRKCYDKSEIDKYINGLKYFSWIQTESEKLEKRRMEIKEEFNLAKSNQEKSELLKNEARNIKKELKNFVRDQWDIESKIIPKILDLPNLLHEKTPCEESLIEFDFLEKPKFDFTPKSHTEISAKNGLLKISPNSHTAYYLLNELALLELGLSDMAQTFLIDSNLEMMSCPDFAKSVIVQGCGNDYRDQNEVFSLQASKECSDVSGLQSMHLVGGASFEPFVSYFCKSVIRNPTALPVAYFCTGRQYKPVPRESTGSLFDTQQSTVVQIFSISNSRHCMNEQLMKQIDAMKEFYKRLNLHFQIKFVSASELERAESFRASIEIFSPHLHRYIEIGNISAYEDYVSKRLMLKHGADGEKLKDTFIVGGTFMNITKMIGMIIENTQNSNETFEFSINL